MRAAMLIIAMLAAGDVLACSCARPETPADQFASSTLVFEGEVRDVEDRLTFLSGLWATILHFLDRDPFETEDKYLDSHGIEYTFAVTRMWRGPASATVKVVTGRGGGDCGCAFEPGKRYLVYAYGGEKGGDFYASICTRTRPSSAAAGDLAYLQTLPLVQPPNISRSHKP